MGSRLAVRDARAFAAIVLALCAGLSCGDSAEKCGPPAAGSLGSERGADLGPDGTPIDEVRITVETGTVNGAGTDKQVLVWFDNQGHKLSSDPESAFAPGERVSASLAGRGVPRTLGELRRSSILLTLHLSRAEIAASWYCEYASVEVRLAGAESYAPYLEVRDVGWLSQDEPPRRSPAYALQ